MYQIAQDFRSASRSAGGSIAGLCDRRVTPKAGERISNVVRDLTEIALTHHRGSVQPSFRV